jgi:hypothetical protein
MYKPAHYSRDGCCRYSQRHKARQKELRKQQQEQEWQRAASGADSTNADASIQILL